MCVQIRIVQSRGSDSATLKVVPISASVIKRYGGYRFLGKALYGWISLVWRGNSARLCQPISLWAINSADNLSN